MAILFYGPVTNAMNGIGSGHPAIDDELKPSTRKFATTILEINSCKFVVTNDRPAVLFAETLVFTFDTIETGRKTTLTFFHRVHLAKHRKLYGGKLGGASRLDG